MYRKPKRITTFTIVCIVFILWLTSLNTFEVWNTIKPDEQLTSGSYESLDQSDEDLIAYTRQSILEPPDLQPYNLTPSETGEPLKFIEERQNPEPIFKELFKNKVGGVFFEAGAYDGYHRSTTLVLEKDYNWTGLMVEGDPKNIELYRLRHRKAWFAPVLISTEKHSTKVGMALIGAKSFIQSIEDEVRTFKCGERILVGYSQEELEELRNRKKCVPYDNRKIVQAIPLYTLLKASGFTEIDFFTLDVEGAEEKILQTIPFHKVNIKVFLIEVTHSSNTSIIAIMKKNNYEVIKKINKVNIHRIRHQDLLFVKKGLLTEGTYTTAY